MKPYLMAEMTMGEVREYLKKKDTVILPYGVVEQHGNHLPLSTDCCIAEMMANLLAEGLGCIVAPTLNYCFSGGMLPGTINVQPNHFSLVVTDIIQSLAVQGFRKIVILAGHGGSESLENLKESLRIAKWTNPYLHDVLVLFPALEEYSPTARKFVFEEHDFHAGCEETSLMLAWRGDLVHMERVRTDSAPILNMMLDNPDAYQKRTFLTKEKKDIPNTEQDPRIVFGVMGHPEKSSVELGKRIMEELRKNMVPAVRKLLKGAKMPEKEK